jgi:hypothetical protein
MPTGFAGSHFDLPLVSPTSVTAQPSAAHWRAKRTAYCPTPKSGGSQSQINQSLPHWLDPKAAACIRDLPAPVKCTMRDYAMEDLHLIARYCTAASAFQQHGCGVIAPWRCRHRLRPYDCCRICQRRFRSEQCLSWYGFGRRTHQYANSGQTLDSIVRYAPV